ncbi:MAG: transposase [Candidatus Binataceae bacterium]|nr:transposase [Candidatus Binataceae bacterium]
MKRVVEGGAKRPIVRRRSFTREFRRLVVKESIAPGASVSSVALRHRLNTNVLFNWRRQYLRELAGVQSVNLLPVKIDGSESIVAAGASESIPPQQSVRKPALPGCIEIEAFGACIRVKGAVDAEALSAVLGVLARR